MSRRVSTKSRQNDSRGFGHTPAVRDLALTRGELALAEALREELARYQGQYPFLLDVQRKARRPSWLPSQKQYRAIRRCLDIEARRQTR